MSTEQNNGMKPAVPPKRSLLSDRRVRLLLSLLGAVIAWMAVTIVVQPGTTTTIYNVPVDFTYDCSNPPSLPMNIPTVLGFVPFRIFLTDSPPIS